MPRDAKSRYFKRVFNFDIEICSLCGGVKVIDCIEDSVVIEKILTHLDAAVPICAITIDRPKKYHGF